MAASAELQRQLADVGLRRAVEDRVSDGEHGVLPAASPDHVDRDVTSRIEGVDHETITRMDDLLVSQIGIHAKASDS